MMTRKQERLFAKKQEKATRSIADGEKFAGKHGFSLVLAKAVTSIPDGMQRAQDLWDWFAGLMQRCDPQTGGLLGKYQEGQRLAAELLRLGNDLQPPGGPLKNTPPLPQPTLIPAMPTSRATSRRVAAAAPEPVQPTPAQIDIARRLGRHLASPPGARPAPAAEIQPAAANGWTAEQLAAGAQFAADAAKPESVGEAPTPAQLAAARTMGWNADQVAKAFTETKAAAEARALARKSRAR